MLKTDEIISAQSCLNKAAPNEMLFVLIARDRAAADTVRFWAGLRVKLGLNAADDAQIVTAMQTADLMDEQGPELRSALGLAPWPEAPAEPA